MRSRLGLPSLLYYGLHLLLLFYSSVHKNIGVVVVESFVPTSHSNHHHRRSLPSTTTTSTSTSTSTSSRHSVVLFGSSFFQQRPGESEKEFFQRIQLAASDPVAFERMALGKDEPPSSSSSSTDDNKNDENDNDDAEAQPKKTGYVSAEEWEAQEKLRKQRGEFTWEEKVQFEGQRMGNQFKQNEILRKNLKGF